MNYFYNATITMPQLSLAFVMAGSDANVISSVLVKVPV